MSRAPSGALIKLSGRISNYKCTRDTANFIFDDSDKTKLGVIAVAAAAAGLGAQAISTASNASAMEEEADFVEFEIAGQQVSGWLWKSPLREGDVVSVAAEAAIQVPANVVAALRLSDRVISLYPHCSRSTTAHIRNALRWWLIGTSTIVAILFVPIVLISGDSSELFTKEFLYASAAIYSFFALMTISLARKYLPFVRVAEKCFEALGLENPSRVDLVKSTKSLRKPNDPPELGVFYFKV